MMIQGIGIDKEEEGYLVSVHYLRSDEEVKMDFIQSQGTTVYEALQKFNAANRTDTHIFSQCHGSIQQNNVHRKVLPMFLTFLFAIMKQDRQ